MSNTDDDSSAAKLGSSSISMVEEIEDHAVVQSPALMEDHAVVQSPKTVVEEIEDPAVVQSPALMEDHAAVVQSPKTMVEVIEDPAVVQSPALMEDHAAVVQSPKTMEDEKIEQDEIEQVEEEIEVESEESEVPYFHIREFSGYNWFRLFRLKSVNNEQISVFVTSNGRVVDYFLRTYGREYALRGFMGGERRPGGLLPKLRGIETGGTNTSSLITEFVGVDFPPLPNLPGVPFTPEGITLAFGNRVLIIQYAMMMQTPTELHPKLLYDWFKEPGRVFATDAPLERFRHRVGIVARLQYFTAVGGQRIGNLERMARSFMTIGSEVVLRRDRQFDHIFEWDDTMSIKHVRYTSTMAYTCLRIAESRMVRSKISQEVEKRLKRTKKEEDKMLKKDYMILKKEEAMMRIDASLMEESESEGSDSQLEESESTEEESP